MTDREFLEDRVCEYSSIHHDWMDGGGKERNEIEDCLGYCAR